MELVSAQSEKVAPNDTLDGQHPAPAGMDDSPFLGYTTCKGALLESTWLYVVYFLETTLQAMDMKPHRIFMSTRSQLNLILLLPLVLRPLNGTTPFFLQGERIRGFAAAVIDLGLSCSVPPGPGLPGQPGPKGYSPAIHGR